MGLGAIDYALHCDRKPAMLVVTDIDDTRLARAQTIFTPEVAKKTGVKLRFMNTRAEGSEQKLMEMTGGAGYDDVLVMAPVKPVVEQADRLLAKDGCLNFFAGPTDSAFSANFNFYNVHYASTHIVGTSGGNTDDMKESLDLMARGRINPTSMITHVGGLDAVVDTTLHLPEIPGGKKLMYTHISMPLTAIADFAELGKTDPMFAELAKIVAKTNGLWSGEAEKYLLSHKIQD
jgi:threonine dehydrogenase-like Zn-dependent dehydrogenase